MNKNKEKMDNVTEACQNWLTRWNSGWGEADGIRGKVRRIKKKPEEQRTESDKETLEEVEEFKKCAYEIELTDSFLFRGLDSEFEPDEELAATSMSLAVAMKYASRNIKGTMIIFVPDRKVHGMIVHHELIGTESEILLTDSKNRLSQHPEMTERKVIDHMKKEEMIVGKANSDFEFDFKFSVWVYK